MGKNPPVLDSAAAAFLAADVQAWTAELQAIDNKIAELNSRRRAFEWKIAAANSATAGIKANKPTAATHASNGGVSTGFRDAIRNVLRSSPNGLTPRQIAEAVLASGFDYKATTDINVRVNNDLHRMLSRRKVERRKGLYYPTVLDMFPVVEPQ